MIKFILEECIIVCGWCVLGRINQVNRKINKKVEKKNIVWSLKKKQVKPSQKTGTCEKWSEVKKKKMIYFGVVWING